MSFSGDSNYIYYTSPVNQEDTGHIALYSVPLLGSVPRLVADEIEGQCASSPDSSQLACLRYVKSAGQEHLFLIGKDGGQERVLLTEPSTESFRSPPAWTPDGKSVSVSTMEGEGGLGRLLVVPVAGTSQRTIFSRDEFDIAAIGWLADYSGLILAASDNDAPKQLWLLSFPQGQLRSLTHDFRSYLGLSITGDSTALAAVQDETTFEIWTMEAGKEEYPNEVRGGADLDFGLSWAPDEKLVFGSKVSGEHELWTSHPDGHDSTQLTALKTPSRGYDFFPDGRSILLSLVRHAKANLWQLDLKDGSLRQLSTGDSDYNPSVSPDGEWAYFMSRRTGPASVWKVNTRTRQETQLTRQYGAVPRVSPDGRFIVCWLAKGADYYIGIITTDGKPVASFPQMPAVDVQWTRDGHHLSYVKTTNDVSNIWIQPISGGPPRQLTHFHEKEIFEHAWSKTGRLAVLRVKEANGVFLIKLR